MNWLKSLTALLALAPWAAQAQTSPTLQKIKDRGVIVCGASQGVAGFSLPDSAGIWTGFDVDMCKALAAVIFNDPTKTRYTPLASKDRLLALQSGEIDVLSRTTTWTLSRNTGQGLNFTAINYYDGQGFMVRKSANVKSLKELNGSTVCVATGTTNELNLTDFIRTNNFKIEPVVYANVDDINAAYESGRCDAYTTDASQLASIRLKMKTPDDHVVLPELISKEPIGPWVRSGDEQWFNLVRWTLFAMINAEELGVTQANVTEMVNSKNPEIRRLLGVENNFGEGLGVSKDWVVRIMKAVGNYGESFERNLGSKSPINLPRGLNKLWTQGGAMYAPPIR